MKKERVQVEFEGDMTDKKWRFGIEYFITDGNWSTN